MTLDRYPDQVPVAWRVPETAFQTKGNFPAFKNVAQAKGLRPEEHTSELQSRRNLVCRLLLEKKNISSL